MGGKSAPAQTVTNVQQANETANRPYEAYGGPEVAPLTADQQTAFGYVRDNLGQATNTVNAANDRISGDNLTGTVQSLLNPYLANVETNAVGNVQRQGALASNDLAAKAAAAGAFGGTRFGVQQGVLSAETARQAGDLSATIRAQGWDKAVSTALTQAQTVGQLAGQGQQLGLQSASALSDAGSQQQQSQQQQYSAAMADWQKARDYPLEQLAIRENSLTSSPYGGTTTSSQPVRAGNPATGALGGALSGAAAGAMLGPWGAAAGAAIGGLGGYLGSR
jgi:hypothetical protein